MPGKRYDFQVTGGPFKGDRCRYVGNSLVTPATAIVELQNRYDSRGEQIRTTLPLSWLRHITQPSTKPRRKRGRR